MPNLTGSPIYQKGLKRQKRKAKRDRKHCARVAGLGCIVCRNQGIFASAEIHHPRDGQGMGQRAPDSEAIPLCPRHHRTGGYGIALHAGQKAFEEAYGTEARLLALVRKLLA